MQGRGSEWDGSLGEKPLPTLHGGPGPMGPKGCHMEPKEGDQRKGPKGRGPYSLMDHE